MKVSELEGAELDYWVGKAGGYEAKLSKTHPEHGYVVYKDAVSCWILKNIDTEKPAKEYNDDSYWGIYEPSWMWHDGGEIIEREKIEIECARNAGIWAGVIVAKEKVHERYGEIKSYFLKEGKTPLIAAMRAYVSSKYGEGV